MTSVALTTYSHSDRQNQSGAVMVLFALLLVGIFGLLGVVIDGGRLRVTKQQLDAGVEIAVLEGLRFKDRDGDVVRRERAVTAMALQWDDDLDPSNGDALGLGAGSLPIVVGAQPLGGKFIASTAAADRVWKPADQLQANLGNAMHGDLVAGSFQPGQLPTEDDTFQRADFVPMSPGSTPTELASSNSFLVRLRRTTDRLALDRQPGVSSSGPAFEWLWARGSAWQEPGPGGNTQSRNDGFTMRATAIASSERALVISNDPTSTEELALIALRGEADSLWDTTAVGSALTLDIGSDGILTVAGVEQGVAITETPRTVGSTLVVSPTALVVVSPQLIVPVYGAIKNQRLVVGYCRASASIIGSTLVVSRLTSAVLPSGASSVSPAALDARVALELSPALRALYSTFSEPVLAPVLRR
jgi:hypothetical protein